MRLIGCGSYLPDSIISNYDLEKRLDTTHDWIVQRTGIHQRCFANEETVANLGAKAALSALASAKIDVTELDFIIVATTSNEENFPSVATKIQAQIGAKQAFAFDIQAVCSGFLYALSVAHSLVRDYRYGLIIGAEKMSNLLNWKDRTTAVLFGDGAGAVVVDNKDNNILAHTLGSDGSLHDILFADPHISMKGQQVFKVGIEKMKTSIQTVLTTSKKEANDISYVIPHQANARMIEIIREYFNLPQEKMVITAGQHANTSAASIPLALSTVWDKIKKGELLLLTAAGAGFTWGSMLVKK